jgi:hypothetical protein
LGNDDDDERTGKEMKVVAFWAVAARSVREVYLCFTGFYCLCHQGDEKATQR